MTFTQSVAFFPTTFRSFVVIFPTTFERSNAFFGTSLPIYCDFNDDITRRYFSIRRVPSSSRTTFLKVPLLAQFAFLKVFFYNNFAFSKVFYIFASRKILIWN